MENPGLLVIGPRDGYSPAVGTLVAMLHVSRHYLLSAVRDLDTPTLDAPPQQAPNTIAALLLHLAAAEAMIGCLTLQNRRFNPDEQALWNPYLNFQEPLSPRGLDLPTLLDRLSQVRQQTLAQLAQQNDDWLQAPRTFFGQPANNHYYWMHFLLDEARHTGQIILLRKHLLPTPQPDFNPYVF